MRKPHALLLAVAFLFVPTLASACTEYTVIKSQTTQWWDGTFTVLITGMEFYSDCTTSAGGGPDYGNGGSGGGLGVPAPIPPTISIINVNTTDPYNPIVTADVASNDPNDPVNVITLEVNGTTVDYAYWGNTAFARYQLRLPAIIYFPDGTSSLTAKACSAAGVCSQYAANMFRTTPSPNTAGTSIFATWLELDEAGEEPPIVGPVPVLKSAYYGHGLRQMYTTTLFGCAEVGETSHYLIRDSLVTISGAEPMPMWSATVTANGTIGWWNSWGLWDSANPVGCTFPVQCSSKSGGVSGAFGFAPSVREAISSFLIDGQPTSITNGWLEIPFQ
jgi:hypothetical protein